jgi:hypothetical protein
MRLYRFLSFEYAVESIETRRLKVSIVKELNDPFEIMPINLSEEQFSQKLEKWKEEFSKHYGLICFSKRWDNILLWSHYADKHKGLVLGFDVSKENCIEVGYTAERLKINCRKAVEQTEHMNKILFDLLGTKAIDWDYEKEVRIVTKLTDCKYVQPLYFDEFSKKLELKEVLIGMECKVSQEDMRKLLTGKLSSVDVKKISPAPSKFGLIQHP